MSSLQALLTAERHAAIAVSRAKAGHSAALLALGDSLKTYFSRYQEIFEPLHLTSQDLGVPLAEVHAEGFHGNQHGWGNRGLRGVEDLPDGFTLIVTEDVFRGERDSFVSYIPSKYLGDAGEALMQQDAIRIGAELAEKREARAQAEALQREAQERQELARLQAQYPAT